MEIVIEINFVKQVIEQISKIYISRGIDVEYGRKDDCSLVDNPHHNRVCFGPCSNDMVDFFSKTTNDVRPKPRIN